LIRPWSARRHHTPTKASTSLTTVDTTAQDELGAYLPGLVGRLLPHRGAGSRVRGRSVAGPRPLGQSRLSGGRLPPSPTSERRRRRTTFRRKAPRHPRGCVSRSRRPCSRYASSIRRFPSLIR